MKFGKWMKNIIDPLCDVEIWTQDEPDEPAFKGSILDIPWYFMDFEIGREDPKDKDEPIFISYKINSNNVILPVLVVNLIAV